MTRRPASGRPPKLPERVAPEPPPPSPPRRPGPRELLKRRRVSGCAHPVLGRAEVRTIARRVAADDPRYAHRLDLGSVGLEDVYGALTRHWGAALDDPRARLDVDTTMARFDEASARIARVGASGGRVIVATSRPASLLGVHAMLASHAAARGATVLTGQEVHGVRGAGRPDRAIWWLSGVAVLTDGSGILAHDDHDVWGEIDFALGRAELVVTDGALAAGALAAGFEVVALADLDHAVLGVAADREHRITVVPAVCSRPAWCYEPLVGLVDGAARSTPSPR